MDARRQQIAYSYCILLRFASDLNEENMQLSQFLDKFHTIYSIVKDCLFGEQSSFSKRSFNRILAAKVFVKIS